MHHKYTHVYTSHTILYISSQYIIHDSIFFHILTIHKFQRLDILHSNISYMMTNILIQCPCLSSLYVKEEILFIS